MKAEYDAVVAGGGIAGLTCAAYLCRSGIHTLLVEKNEKPGGLVNTFRYEGFAFDGGIRAFENSGILLPMLKDLGIDIAFRDNPVAIGIAEKWIRFGSLQNLSDYAAVLTNLFPADAAEIAQIMEEIMRVHDYMEVLYGMDNPLFLSENITHDPVYLRKILLPWLLRYRKTIQRIAQMNEPVDQFLRRFTDNTALIDLITQHFFKNTPAFFALSYFGLYLDYLYPVGGTGILADKLTDYITAGAGEILTGTAVLKINPEKREVVLSDDRIIGYKQLIWAADQKMFCKAVEPPYSQAFQKKCRVTETALGAESILTLFIGSDLNREFYENRCGAHAFYTPSEKGITTLPDWKKHVAGGTKALYAWLGDYLERTTYEISCPSLCDPELAPVGKTGVIVSTLMDYELVKTFSDAGEYETYKKYCTEKIIRVLGISIFPDFAKNMRFSICATPMTIAGRSGNAGGTITGWSFANNIMPSENQFRRIQKSVRTPIRDIRQCGQWTFSPGGLPVCVLTGRLAAKEAERALQKYRPKQERK